MITYLLSYKVREAGMRWDVTKYQETATIEYALTLATRLIEQGHAVHIQPIEEPLK